MKIKIFSLVLALVSLTSLFVVPVSANGSGFKFPIDVNERYTDISYVDETNVFGEVVSDEEQKELESKKTVYIIVLSVLLVVSIIILIVTLKRAKDDKLVKKAISYINSNFSENINLETIAGELYISVNQLCRIFKKNLGTTVTKYIAGKRISEAKKLLKNGHSVSDTAILCGYRDYANFIRSFKKNVGVSPGKYAMHN
jgi:AraC-like DNA-binding protein